MLPLMCMSGDTFRGKEKRKQRDQVSKQQLTLIAFFLFPQLAVSFSADAEPCVCAYTADWV